MLVWVIEGNYQNFESVAKGRKYSWFKPFSVCEARQIFPSAKRKDKNLNRSIKSLNPPRYRSSRRTSICLHNLKVLLTCVILYFHSLYIPFKTYAAIYIICWPIQWKFGACAIQLNSIFRDDDAKSVFPQYISVLREKSSSG